MGGERGQNPNTQPLRGALIDKSEHICEVNIDLDAIIWVGDCASPEEKGGGSITVYSFCKGGYRIGMSVSLSKRRVLGPELWILLGKKRFQTNCFQQGDSYGRSVSINLREWGKHEITHGEEEIGAFSGES